MNYYKQVTIPFSFNGNEYRIAENSENQLYGDITFCGYSIQHIIIQKNSFWNIRSLHINGNKGLQTIRLGDGTFQNTVDVSISSNSNGMIEWAIDEPQLTTIETGENTFFWTKSFKLESIYHNNDVMN